MALVSPRSLPLPPPTRMLSTMSTMSPPLTNTTNIHSISAPPSAFKLSRSLSRPRSTSTHSLSPPTSPITPTSSYSGDSVSSPLSPSPSLLAIKTPRILATVLSFLDWHEVLALFNTCRETQALFRVGPNTRDVILSRFIPGYATALRNRDWTRYKDVQVTIQDVTLLLKSQQLAVHRYPMHALAMISALYSTVEQTDQNDTLVALTQAHSRFVLLLQSIVHSSPSLIPPEPEELRWGPCRSSYQQPSTIRELTFPAPLSFAQPQKTDSAAPPNARSSTGPFRSRFFRAMQKQSQSSMTLTIDPPRTLRKDSRSLSVFRGRTSNRPSAPPPPSIPQTLKLYSTAWRRTLVHQTPNITPGILSDDDYEDGADSDVTNLSLRRPRRRFASDNTSSSNSSITSPSSSRSRPGSVDGHISLSPLSFSPTNGVITRLTSPHDLSLATLRTRAPILRVFVPCTELEWDGDGIIRCENQLIQFGLWEHLSTGDIVCNLGYVPTEEPDSSGSVLGEVPSSPLGRGPLQHQLSVSTASSSTGDPRKRWLLYNGTCLVPYSPPELLPLSDPLSLPTPWYYFHIMNSQENPRFMIPRVPPPRNAPDFEAGEQWSMIKVQAKVRSPHSAGGWAMVQQYRWTVKVLRTPAIDTMSDVLGAGWTGEWTLEGEGTKEGRQVLQECLRGKNGAPMEWEFVREKSHPGRLWLKLLTSSPPVTDFTDDLNHTQSS